MSRITRILISGHIIKTGVSPVAMFFERFDTPHIQVLHKNAWLCGFSFLFHRQGGERKKKPWITGFFASDQKIFCLIASNSDFFSCGTSQLYNGLGLLFKSARRARNFY